LTQSTCLFWTFSISLATARVERTNHAVAHGVAHRLVLVTGHAVARVEEGLLLDDAEPAIPLLFVLDPNRHAELVERIRPEH
jgi:hypothetical protein